MIKLGIKIAVSVLVAVLAFSYLSMKKENSEKKFTPTPMQILVWGFMTIKIGGAEILAEIADTPQKRVLGLSGRDKLAENGGMIFVFDNPSIRNFWMKDMKFALDIIWIDENKKVIGIEKNALPESFPEKFTSPSPAKYVLEVNDGFADKYKIKIGDIADF